MLVVNTEVSESSSCVHGYHIINFISTFRMQLLARHSDVKESLKQTKAIDMRLPLRDGIITGYLPHKCLEPVTFP